MPAASGPLKTPAGESWKPVAAGLREAEEGLWVAADRPPVSYPDSGNDACFQVEDQSFWFGHRNRCIIATVKRFPPAGLLADVGGGNGFVARGLQSAGIQTALIEPGEAGARNGWLRGVRPVLCSTLQQSGFPLASLAGIGAFDVVEHIEDDVAFLRLMHAYLRPGGRLFITVPAYTWLWSSEDHDAGHFRRYSPASLRRAMEDAGFIVDYWTGLFAWLPVPIAIYRSLSSRMGVKRQARNQLNADHRMPGGISGRILRSMLDAEFNLIASGRHLPVGSSLLAVGRVAA